VDTKVDVVFWVTDIGFTENPNPLRLPEELKIPMKPKAPAPETNGHATINGTVPKGTTKGITNGSTNGATKRKASDASLEDDIIRKKGKVMEEPAMNDDQIVIQDDPNDDAIVIDDD
jgi:ubiquitin-like 1-activating enzyme E1 B